MSAEFDKVCFVVMPYGNKPSGIKKRRFLLWQTDHQIDFDNIYGEIFEPAIKEVDLPEGGKLVAHRADKAYYSGLIDDDLYEYLEYSRLVLTDLTASSPNVYYETGIRHRARSTGTVLLRQLQVHIPFDLSHLRVFPYECETDEQREEARQLITRVLSVSLKEGRLDSPFRGALAQQKRAIPGVEQMLIAAEKAIQAQDWGTAIARLREAVRLDPANALAKMKLGLLLRERGQWREALDQFASIVKLTPDYAEAYREKGIAENKIAGEEIPASGEESLRKAIALNAFDFDAFSALGGVLKRQGKFDEALEMYQQATKLSLGNPYPLLNEIKLQARAERRLVLDPVRLTQLSRAAQALEAQVKQDPPYNAPWSLFDLAEIRLYTGNSSGFLDLIDRGINTSAKWQITTFLKSLELLVEGGVRSESLDAGIAKLRAAQTAMID